MRHHPAIVDSTHRTFRRKPYSVSQAHLPGLEGVRLDAIKAKRLPTNTTANRHAFHRWFNFTAGFSPEFVDQQCPTEPSSLVLDPFAGCGTTLVVAQSRQLQAIGFEPHPFFVRIARAKTDTTLTTDRLNAIEGVLVDGLHRKSDVELSDDASTFLGKLFDSASLRMLLNARAALADSAATDDDVAFLLLSRVVDLCSKARTDGIYKAPTSTKRAEAPIEAVRAVVRTAREDIELGRHSWAPQPATVHQTPSQDMSVVPARTVDAVITSPPYLNNFDFAEMTRMYLYFWGICGSWREISERVRSRLVVNTTTALAGHRREQSHYREQIPLKVLADLDDLVTRLRSERNVRRGRKEYDLLVFPYFSQMLAILTESLRCLKPGAKTNVVVADAALYGVHISTPQILATIMSELGFEKIQVLKFRERGHRWRLAKRDGSPTGLGEYHIIAERSPA